MKNCPAITRDGRTWHCPICGQSVTLARPPRSGQVHLICRADEPRAPQPVRPARRRPKRSSDEPSLDARRAEIVRQILVRLRTMAPIHKPDKHRPMAEAEAAVEGLAAAGHLDQTICSEGQWHVVRDVLQIDLWRREWGTPPAQLRPSPRARIVHYMPWHLTTGGAQRMLDVWCQMESDRWDVHIVTNGVRGAFAMPGATVHAAIDPRKIDQLLTTLAPDVLVHHTPAESTGKKTACRQVWILHGMPTMREPCPRHTAPTAVVSNLESDEFHPSWRSLPMHVIPLGVDLDAYRPRPDAGTIKPAPDGQPISESPMLGFVGRLHVEKFPETFARTLATWDRGPWRLRVIGEGWRQTHQDAVRRILAGLPWIEWAGDVEPARIPDALAGLDALIVPTDLERGETGCYSAIEAMACGLPIVARDVPGLRQSCRDGAVYGVTDEDLLAAVRSLDSPDTRAKLGRRARQVAEEIHDLRAWATAHSRVYAEAMRVDVSILLPVYNTPARMLVEAWASIQAQTFRQWELVLVDDGSTAAETVAAIDRIADDPRVRLMRLPENQGLSAALNAGLAQCRADLVARMDGDDVMLPDRLAEQVAHIAEHPECDILGTQIEVFSDHTGKPISRSDHPAVVTAEHVDRQRLARGVWYLNHPTVVFRRPKIQSVGGYDPRYRVAQDLDLWERCRAAGLTIHNLPGVLLRYRAHPGQVTFGGAAILEHDTLIG